MIPIYDPRSTRPGDDGRVIRDPFPNNVIPPSAFDPVAEQLVDYWPEPNRPPANIAGAQNFRANIARKFTRDNLTARLDHVFTDKNRLYVRLLYNRNPYKWTSSYPQEEADPRGSFRPNRYQITVLVADTHNVTPNLFTDIRFSFAHRIWHRRSAGLGSDIVDRIGLKGVPAEAFPAIRITGVAALGNSGERRQFPIRQQQFVNNWTWIRGSHILKFGGELRRSRNYEINRPIIAGQYRFLTTGTGLPGTKAGHAYASYLTGFVNSFLLRETEVLDRYNWYLAWFFQDDWKVTPNLTLNLGLRWETDTPITDRNDRVNSFDMTAINPVSGTPGVVTFGGQPYQTDWNNFGPRFGFAWRPRGSDVWVIRGGYGVFYEHPFTGGAPSSASLGFERSAGLSSPDNGVTPAFWLRDGVEGIELQPPVRDSSFGAVPVGKRPTTNVDFYEPNRRTGYAQHFNFGVQRQLPGEMVVEVSYLGNLGRKMPLSHLPINQVPPQLMGPGNAQVRRPFPQFNRIRIIFPTMGSHNYHAGLIRVEKRISHGLSFLTSYTFARNIGNINQIAGGELGANQIYQDYYNRRLDKGPLAIDIKHRFVWSSVYDLPFGQGRRWLRSGVLSYVLGGWRLGSIVTLQSGGPFTVTMETNTTNAFSAGPLRANVLRDPNLPQDQRTVYRWFDTEAFEAPPEYTFGNAGRGIVRADGRVRLDFSITKDFYLNESTYVQFRTDLFNAFNHPDFAPPNSTMGTPSFGQVTEATDPRSIQFGLRFVF